VKLIIPDNHENMDLFIFMKTLKKSLKEVWPRVKIDTVIYTDGQRIMAWNPGKEDKSGPVDESKIN